jgi:hypothetical protein
MYFEDADVGKTLLASIAPQYKKRKRRYNQWNIIIKSILSQS